MTASSSREKKTDGDVGSGIRLDGVVTATKSNADVEHRTLAENEVQEL